MDKTTITIVLGLLGFAKTLLKFGEEIDAKFDELAAFIKERAGIDPTAEEMAAAMGSAETAHNDLQSITIAGGV